MLISLNNGISYREVINNVRIVYKGVAIPGEEDQYGEIHVCLSDEGIIMDVWASRVESLDHNIGTSSETVEEIAERLVAEGA